MPKVGIQQMSDVLILAFTAMKEVRAAGADGKYDLRDLPHAFAIFKKIGPAIKGIGEVPAEFLDIDRAERKELAVLTRKGLEAAGHEVHNIEGIVDSGLAFVGAGIRFYKESFGKSDDSTHA